MFSYTLRINLEFCCSTRTFTIDIYIFFYSIIEKTNYYKIDPIKHLIFLDTRDNDRACNDSMSSKCSKMREIIETNNGDSSI